MPAHGFKNVADAIRSLQSTGAELLARNLSVVSPVVETRSYLRRLQIENAVAALNVVHVAGTKGKGSVAAFTESIVRHFPHGRPLRTGLFTSPHLRDVTERIRVGGSPLPAAEFEARFWRVFDRLYETRDECGDAPPMPGFFRFFTVLAFDVFLAADVDVAVFEVGIGGLLDPTNVIPAPIACGITSIGYDHCDVLGDTLEAIAFQKAGIIKPGCEAVTGAQPSDSVINVIRARAEKEQVPLHIVPPLPPDSVELGISGRHQHHNAAIALRLAQIVLNRLRPGALDRTDLLAVPEVRTALRTCRWPGRCQRVAIASNLTLFIDGAHTVESSAACGTWFHENAQAAAVNVLVFNCAVGRDPVALLAALDVGDLHVDYLFSCPFNQERPHLHKRLPTVSDFAADAVGFPAAQTWQETIVHSWTYVRRGRDDRSPTDSEVLPSVADVLVRLREMAQERPDVQFQALVTGSLYLAGDMLDALNYPIA